MKPRMAALFLLTLFVSSVGFSSMAPVVKFQPKASKFDGYVIKFKNDRVANQIQRELESAGNPAVSQIRDLRAIVVKKVPQLSAASQAQVEYIEPNYLVHANLKSARLGHKPLEEDALVWGMNAINAREAWAVGTGQKSVVVAVSDTGAFEHVELHKNFWANPGETGTDSNGKDKAKNGIDDDANGFIDDVRGWNFNYKSAGVNDMHFHGTHVSGTIGAGAGDKTGVVGVVWNTQLMQVPFLGRDGWGTDADGAATIIYAANNGAKVLNASWGGTEEAQILKDAIDYAKTKGMLVIAAAGNDSVDNDRYPHYPSSYDCENLIAVAATTASKEMAGFSNWGIKSVDLAAPGDNIYSSVNPTGPYMHGAFYYDLSGTSMATPHVTGAVALLYSINPNLTWRQVKELIFQSTTPLKDLQGKVVTGGILNVGRAAKMAQALK